ncbi:MAG: type II toxin-antitoxin system VapC family toxin [Candidatus Baltobacteraceae bacterium]
MIVIDASVALAWFLEDPGPHIAALVYVGERGGVVPGNFQSELVHGLLRAERQKRIGAAEAAEALDALLELSLDVDLPDPKAVMTTAREHGLSGYDASYLALAMQAGVQLATADAVLAKAARRLDLLWRPVT